MRDFVLHDVRYVGTVAAEPQQCTGCTFFIPPGTYQALVKSDPAEVSRRSEGCVAAPCVPVATDGEYLWYQPEGVTPCPA